MFLCHVPRAPPSSCQRHKERRSIIIIIIIIIKHLDHAAGQKSRAS
jgi:hypothetical protein